MIKTFQKKSPIIKTFFSKNMQVRSLAYGDGVRLEFKKWVQEYFPKRLKCNGKFVLFEDDEILGVSAKEREEKNKTAQKIKPLCLEGEWFSLDGGQVLLDDKKVLNAGKEIKAMSLAYFTAKGKSKCALLIIGKKPDSENTTLTAYKFDRLSRTIEESSSVILPTEFNDKSLLTCLGRHVFAVHGQKLYYYYLCDKLSLQQVAIGENNLEEKPFLTNVKNVIITDGNDKVFWTCGEAVYNLKIGFPTAIEEVCLRKNDNITNIRFDDGQIEVSGRKKNGYDAFTERY